MAHPRTLGLFLHVGCAYCEQSFGFYSRLVRLESSHVISAHVVALFPDQEAAVRTEVAGVIPSARAISDVDLRSLGVSVTPTLVRVDSRGKVLRSWLGLLSPSEEADVIRAAADPGTIVGLGDKLDQ